MTRDPAFLVAGAIAAQVMGGVVPQMSPLIVGGLIDGLSLSERQAGLIVFTELLALAVAATLTGIALSWVSYRRVALVAALLTMVAQVASIFAEPPVSLVLLRGLAGMGEGALYAVSLCLIASHSYNPVKIYGCFQIVWAVGSIALFSVGGQLAASFAHRGIFALVAGLTLTFLPLLLLVPDSRSNAGERTGMGAAPPSPLLGAMTLAAIVLYITASAAIYTFSAPLGERAGLDTRSVGYALTIGSLAGLAGAGAATAVNVRWGRLVPISGFCAGFAVVVLALCLSRDPGVYLIAVVGSVVVYYFSMPYLLGLAAALDRSGRWAAAGGSAYLFGFAAGPLVAGAVVSAMGYVGLAAVCIAITGVAFVLAIAVSRRLPRTMKGDRLNGGATVHIRPERMANDDSG